MGDVNLEVWDATGNKRVEVEVPDGQLMSYKFHHRRLGIQLFDDKTLADQQVVDGDVLRIQPEITAGGVSRI